MKTVNLVNISKRYGKIFILKKINFRFESGKCYLIIGANGAGKSTLLKLINKMIFPTEGDVKLNILKIGYVPDKNVLPQSITVDKFLFTMTKIKKDNFINTIMLMKYFNIYMERYKKISHLSKGMIQKVLIIQAFLGNPDILIFDEALNGLDTVMQEKLINLIKLVKDKDKIIIITSHYPSYYDEIVDMRLKVEDGKIN